jgi:hypothetical protein
MASTKGHQGLAWKALHAVARRTMPNRDLALDGACLNQ